MRKQWVVDELTEEPFYIMNDYAQYWIGLRYGKGAFDDDFNKARTLVNDAQFRMLKRLSDCPIEKIYT